MYRYDGLSKLSYIRFFVKMDILKDCLDRKMILKVIMISKNVKEFIENQLLTTIRTKSMACFGNLDLKPYSYPYLS